MISVRAMIDTDADAFPALFRAQGWNKPSAQFRRYLEEQSRGIRRTFVGLWAGEPAGYVTLLPEDDEGPFAHKGIPVLCDFNVLEKYQRRGIGTALLDAAEAAAAQSAQEVCLGVGLHSGYGTAQSMYGKRGYIPDGSGLWYQNHVLSPYTACVNDDDLILYLSKKFKK